MEIVKFFKGAELSANFPYKVQFQLEVDGKQKKFFAHLVSPGFVLIKTVSLSDCSISLMHGCRCGELHLASTHFLACLTGYDVSAVMSTGRGRVPMSTIHA